MNSLRCKIVALVVALATAATVAAAGDIAAAADDAGADVKAFAGTWKIVNFEAAGKKVTDAPGAPDKAIIKDGTATFFSQGKELPTFKNLKIEIDPAKNPKAMNLKHEKDQLPCIYELDDDELKIAMPLVPGDKKPEDSLPRPESFDTSKVPVLVFTLHRDKE